MSDNLARAMCDLNAKWETARLACLATNDIEKIKDIVRNVTMVQGMRNQWALRDIGKGPIDEDAIPGEMAKLLEYKKAKEANP